MAASALVLAAGCGPDEASRQRIAVVSGKLWYQRSLCVQCHGPDARGAAQGPPLTQLKPHWTEETLAAFLKDPIAGLKDSPRLQEVAARYTAVMPPVPMNAETRRQVAAYLLSLSE